MLAKESDKTEKLQDIGTADRCELLSQDQLVSRMVGIWEDLLGVEEVLPDDNFFELGGDSISAQQLCAQIKTIWGKSLPLAALFEAPTAKQLATLVGGKSVSKSSPKILQLKSDGSRPPFLCVDAGPLFLQLAQRMSPDQPFLGLRLLDTHALPIHFTLADIAAYHLQTIFEIQPHGPYYLGGWSASGLVAYEVAQQLRNLGHDVAVIVLFDSANFSIDQAEASGKRFSHWGWKFRYHVENLTKLKLSEKWEYLREFGRQARKNLSRNLWKVEHAIQLRFRGYVPVALRDPWPAVFTAACHYHPEAYTGRVVLFRSAIQSEGPETDYKLGWGDVLGENLEIFDVPGDHDDMFLEPHVDLLASQLKSFLGGR